MIIHFNESTIFKILLLMKEHKFVHEQVNVTLHYHKVMLTPLLNTLLNMTSFIK